MDYSHILKVCIDASMDSLVVFEDNIRLSESITMDSDMIPAHRVEAFEYKVVSEDSRQVIYANHV